MEHKSNVKTQLAGIWAEKRVVGLCFFIALSQFQYGYDSAAVAGFQSMPGFLIVFGYRDVRPSGCPFCQSLIIIPACANCYLSILVELRELTSDCVGIA